MFANLSEVRYSSFTAISANQQTTVLQQIHQGIMHVINLVGMMGSWLLTGALKRKPVTEKNEAGIFVIRRIDQWKRLKLS